MKDLLERVKAATGPDRELDGALAEAFGWRQITVDHGLRLTREWLRPDGFPLPVGTMADPPFFTASLDAALALVERALPGWSWAGGNTRRDDNKGGCWAVLYDVSTVKTAGKASNANGVFATVQLAVVAALLSVGGPRPLTHESR